MKSLDEINFQTIPLFLQKTQNVGNSFLGPFKGRLLPAEAEVLDNKSLNRVHMTKVPRGLKSQLLLPFKLMSDADGRYVRSAHCGANRRSRNPNTHHQDFNAFIF